MAADPSCAEAVRAEEVSTTPRGSPVDPLVASTIAMSSRFRGALASTAADMAAACAAGVVCEARGMGANG